jgi:hypothetical protein
LFDSSYLISAISLALVKLITFAKGCLYQYDKTTLPYSGMQLSCIITRPLIYLEQTRIDTHTCAFPRDRMEKDRAEHHD